MDRVVCHSPQKRPAEYSLRCCFCKRKSSSGIARIASAAEQASFKYRPFQGSRSLVKPKRRRLSGFNECLAQRFTGVEGVVSLFSTTLDLVAKFEGHGGAINALHFSVDGQMLY